MFDSFITIKIARPITNKPVRNVIADAFMEPIIANDGMILFEDSNKVKVLYSPHRIENPSKPATNAIKCLKIPEQRVINFIVIN